MAALRVLMAAALLALPLWFARSTPAHACTYSLDDSIRSADIIATGTIGEMLVLPPESVAHPEMLYGRMPVETKFSVDEYLKGSGPAQLLLFHSTANVLYGAGGISGTFDISSACGLEINVGDQFVVLLQRNDPLRYAISAGTGNLADEGIRQSVVGRTREVLAQPGGLPSNGSGPPARSHIDWLVPLIAGSGCVAVSVGFLMLTRRRS